MHLTAQAPPEEIDLRAAARLQYQKKTRPLRYLVSVIGIALGSLFVLGVVLQGVTPADGMIGAVLLIYAAFAGLALTRMLVRGPVELRLRPGWIELVYATSRVRSVPITRRGTTIELSDLSSSRILGRPAAGRGIAWLLRIDSGATIALTQEALAALNSYLRQSGIRAVYEGSITGAPGSHVWRYAVT